MRKNHRSLPSQLFKGFTPIAVLLTVIKMILTEPDGIWLSCDVHAKQPYRLMMTLQQLQLSDFWCYDERLLLLPLLLLLHHCCL